MENTEPKFVCRKCKGAHLTIKCGKETKSVIELRNDALKSVTYPKKDINFKSERLFQMNKNSTLPYRSDQPFQPLPNATNKANPKQTPNYKQQANQQASH